MPPQNNRLYFATEAVGIAKYTAPTSWLTVRGVQNVGMSGRIPVEYVHELGNLPTYDTYDETPEVEISFEKVLDGHPPVYTLATQDATTPDLAGRGNQRCHVALSTHRDYQSAASGGQLRQCLASGFYTNSLGYDFSNSAPAKETVSLVGNSAVWTSGSFTFNGRTAANGVSVEGPLATEGVNRRQHMLMPQCRLPKDIPGISTSGTNDEVTVGQNTQFSVSIESIRVAASFGRSSKTELGRKGPYFRGIEWPVEVTTTIEFAAKDGDDPSLYENADNTTDQQILLRMQEGLVLDLGAKNVRNSQNHTGGQAGSRGDVMKQYSYTNHNELIVQHPADPTTALRP